MALSSNDDFWYNYIVSICHKCSDIMQNRAVRISKFKMINFCDATNEIKTEYILTWPYILDHLYWILIIGGSRSGKKNALFNLIINEPDIDKIYLYAKDPYEVKHQS